ncbi:hypothetical protein KSP40_PGU009890 [Platanthera guangdongensis]|uniref:No apical meristem-associated C-terminal domain-containing protein n=1 Tax=Platanthera guangdongensis TaxID=2320717 RepID=A0ABR2MIK2_9ASPA
MEGESRFRNSKSQNQKSTTANSQIEEAPIKSKNVELRSQMKKKENREAAVMKSKNQNSRSCPKPETQPSIAYIPGLSLSLALSLLSLSSCRSPSDTELIFLGLVPADLDLKLRIRSTPGYGDPNERRGFLFDHVWSILKNTEKWIDQSGAAAGKSSQRDDMSQELDSNSPTQRRRTDLNTDSKQMNPNNTGDEESPNLISNTQPIERKKEKERRRQVGGKSGDMETKPKANEEILQILKRGQEERAKDSTTEAYLEETNMVELDPEDTSTKEVSMEEATMEFPGMGENNTGKRTRKS